jgi:hypothetical protein
VYPQPPVLDAQLRQREIDINPIEIPVRVMKLGDPSATKSALAGIGRAVTVGTIRPTALRDASMPLRSANDWPPAAAVGRVNTATLATTPSNVSSTNPRVCERRDSSPATTPISATRGAGPGLHPREILLPAVDENRRHPVAVLGSQLRVHIAGAPYNVHLGTDPAISLGTDTELDPDNCGLKDVRMPSP